MQFNNLMAMWRKPFYVFAGVFPANTDLSWIPDAPSDFSLVSPAEAADGSRLTFTFTNVPKVALWNGVWYLENYGYTRNGFVITFTDDIGAPIAPETGAVIRAIY